MPDDRAPSVVGSFPSATATTPKNGHKKQKKGTNRFLSSVCRRALLPRPFALKLERNATAICCSHDTCARGEFVWGKSSTFSAAAARNFCRRCQQHEQMHGAGICSGFASCSRQVLCVDFGFQFRNGVTWNWFLYKHAHTHTHQCRSQRVHMLSGECVCVCAGTLSRARSKNLRTIVYATAQQHK